MAETFSVVVGGVALAEVAAKITKNTLKLRQLWKNAKNMPANAVYLTEQICLFEPILKGMEEDFGPNRPGSQLWDELICRQLTTHCRKALTDLETSIEDLKTRLESPSKKTRRMEQLRVAKEGEFWSLHEQRLERIMGALTWAHQLYQTALMKQQLGVIQLRTVVREELRASLEASAVTSQASTFTGPHLPQEQNTQSTSISELSKQPLGSFARPGFKVLGHWIGASSWGAMSMRSATLRTVGQFGEQVEPYSTLETWYYSLQIRPPSYWSRKAWDMVILWSQSGFTYHFRTYPIVPYHSPAFECARAGDIEGLRHLFKRGAASPFDRSENGRTLVEAAAFEANIEMIRFLDSHSLVWKFEDSESSCVAALGGLFGAWSRQRLEEFHDLLISRNFYHVLHNDMPHLNEPGDSEYMVTEAFTYDGLFTDVSKMRLILPHLRPSHYQSPLAQRFKWDPIPNNWHPRLDAKAFALAIRSDGELDLTDLTNLHKQGVPLLAGLITQYIWYGDVYRATKWREVRKMIQKCLRTEAIGSVTFWYDRLPRLVAVGGTALTALFIEAELCRPIRRKAVIDERLQMWVEDLQAAGLDILDYGETERSLHFAHAEDLSKGILGTWFDEPALMDFTYGPDPKDWRLIWALEEDREAERFFNIVDSCDEVEEPPLHMPGAYVESDCDSE